MDAVQRIIKTLGLRPLQPEGGHFHETYRSDESHDGEALPGRYRGPRHVSTAIYYLLTPETFSAMHRLRSDEVYHFYLGDPVELLLLGPGPEGRRLTIGSHLGRGQRPQVIVPRGVWQGSRLRPGGRFALMGATVAPGYHHDDFDLGGRNKLTRKYPAFEAQIKRLTRPSS